MRGNWLRVPQPELADRQVVEVERFDAQQGPLVLLDAVQPLGLGFPPLLDDRFPVGFLGHLGAVFDPGVHVLPPAGAFPAGRADAGDAVVDVGVVVGDKGFRRFGGVDALPVLAFEHDVTGGRVPVDGATTRFGDMGEQVDGPAPSAGRDRIVASSNRVRKCFGQEALSRI